MPGFTGVAWWGAAALRKHRIMGFRSALMSFYTGKAGEATFRIAMNHHVIGIIGAGNMARSLAGGLVANGWRKQDLILSDLDPQQRKAVTETLGLVTYENNDEVATRADVIVLAIKPQLLRGVAAGIAASTQKTRPLVVSIAAGVRVDDLQRWLGGGLAIIRVMPNTAALIGSGAAGLFANEFATQSQRDEAESILRAVGVTVWLEAENLMDVVTAVSGSGPAYFFLVMEELERAALKHGLDAATARLLTLETAYGAAKMALEGGEEPAQLRRRVTSPGGTTERAVQVLEEGHIGRLFNDAVTAAVERARELAEILGKQ